MPDVTLKNASGQSQTYLGKNLIRIPSGNDYARFTPEPSGTLQITQNGTYDVTAKASAVVNVSGGAAIITGLIDRTITSVDLTGVTDIGDYAFCGCSQLASISIPGSVETIGNSAFSGTAITQIVIPDTVTYVNPRGLFSGCYNLEDVVFPENLEEPVLYPWEATKMFYFCFALKTIVFPDVHIFLNDTFLGNSHLQSITFMSTSPPSPYDVTNGQSRSIQQIPSTCTIYVPASALNDYQTDQYWQLVASQIQAIPT